MISPSQHRIASRGVCVVSMGDRAHDTVLVSLTCQARQQLANPDAGDVSCNRLKFAPYLIRRLRFWIPGVELGWPTCQEEQDTAFRPSETCRARLGRGCRGLP